jgi:uncharacterized oligopeptide transporter (OPT) family protein
MFERLRKLLNNIQNSDESVKKRWLIASSALAMILVIGLWLVYMNWALNSFDKTAQKQESETGFWQIFKTGLNVVGESVWSNIKSFVQKITGERTIEIQ